jgi:hypothetical protein
MKIGEVTLKQLLVCNSQPDAQFYEVWEINGRVLGVKAYPLRWQGRTNYWDISLFQRPNARQLHRINKGGKNAHSHN